MPGLVCPFYFHNSRRAACLTGKLRLWIHGQQQETNRFSLIPARTRRQWTQFRIEAFEPNASFHKTVFVCCTLPCQNLLLRASHPAESHALALVSVLRCTFRPSSLLVRAPLAVAYSLAAVHDTMRYDDWDVLLFPSGRNARVPLKEFKVGCHVVPDAEFIQNKGTYGLPTMTCFVPSLQPGVHFHISIHCWDTPRISQYSLNYSKHPDLVKFEARILIDGRTVA